MRRQCVKTVGLVILGRSLIVPEVNEVSMSIVRGLFGQEVVVKIEQYIYQLLRKGFKNSGEYPSGPGALWDLRDLITIDISDWAKG